MRTIIAGSRTIGDIRLIDLAVDESGFTITRVISGCAMGVDALGEQWAEVRGVPISKFPADWELGRGAGFQRNCQMAINADALIAVWDGRSKGTAHMIIEAHRKGLKVYVKVVT
jgi:hypothetical protein